MPPSYVSNRGQSVAGRNDDRPPISYPRIDRSIDSLGLQGMPSRLAGAQPHPAEGPISDFDSQTLLEKVNQCASPRKGRRLQADFLNR